MAKVVPIHKSGSNDDITNYRPISILSTFAKVFESLLCPYFQNHLKLFISDHQHGFVGSRSTSSNLVTFTELLVEAVDSGHQADVIYTDFSKAFDKVSHKILSCKLRAYGIAGGLLEWVISYLKGRSFFVVVNGYQSNVYNISSGVPQGSHLGPILFNYFINDIPNCLRHSKFFMYADDLKFLRIVESDRDASLLQMDLNSLIQWCKINEMCLNSKKCYHVKYTRKNYPINTVYYINEDKVNEVDTIRDLGVLFDKKLTFAPHLDHISKKASRMMGFVIRQCKGFRQIKTKILLYQSLVRSILEYCSVVWRPHYATNSLRLERVQKRFVWHLAFSVGITKKVRSYKNRLKFFNMHTLEERRCLNDAMFASKILKGNIDSPPLLALINFRAPSRIPRKPITPLCPPMRRTVLGSNSPCARFCRVLNSCSDIIDLHFDSLSMQKCKFLKWLSDLL